MSESTVLLPYQPTTMSTAQLAAVSYLARYAGHTHHLYAYQLKRWFAWCESNGLDPLVGIQRAHVELYIRQLGDSAHTRCVALLRSPTHSMPACPSATLRSSRATPTHAPPSITTGHAATSTVTASTSSPPTSQVSEHERKLR